MILQEVKKELAKLVKTEIADEMVSKLMGKFDEEIIPFEDEDDPSRPSLFRNEFKEYLKQSIIDSVEVAGNSIKYGIGDPDKLGFGEGLDPNTTDGLKIIGTILGGIAGEYVLVTVEMARRMFPESLEYDLGRTGLAYLMARGDYNSGVDNHGWEPRSMWSFSNFPGVPDFFDIEIDLGKHIDRLVKDVESRIE